MAALALVWESGSPGRARDWREPLALAEEALARGDAHEAERAWEEAHRAAIRAGASRGMLELGRAYLSIGEAAHDRATAVECGICKILLQIGLLIPRRTDLETSVFSMT